MQRQLLKIISILLPLILCSQVLFAQVSAFRLQQADSLYQNKRFTQSLDQYQSILNQNQYTPAMLLKMAYIEEGLNRVGQALYYLNLYYLASNDKFVLEKMEELATKHNLNGYENTDADIALSVYHDYQFPVSIFLAVMAVFFLSLILYWKKKGSRSVATAVLLFAVLMLLVVHINFGGKETTGIIGDPNTYLMDGPSAGASVISVINEGHRVEVVRKVDVWYEVRWNDDVAFVRDHDVLLVGL